MSQRIESIKRSAAQAARFIDDALHPVRTRDREFHLSEIQHLARAQADLLQTVQPLESKDSFSPGCFEGLALSPDRTMQLLIAGQPTYQTQKAIWPPGKYDHPKDLGRLNPSTALTLKLIAPEQSQETQSHFSSLSPAIRALEATEWVTELPHLAKAIVTFSETDSYYVLSLDHDVKSYSPFTRKPYNLPRGTTSIFIGKDSGRGIHIREGDSFRHKATVHDAELMDNIINTLKTACDGFVSKPTGTEILRPIRPDEATRLVHLYAASYPDLLIKERDLRKSHQELLEMLAYNKAYTDAVLKLVDKDIADLERVLGLSEENKRFLTSRKAFRQQLLERRKFEDEANQPRLDDLAAALALYDEPNHPSWSKLSPVDAAELTVLLRHPKRLASATQRV